MTSFSVLPNSINCREPSRKQLAGQISAFLNSGGKIHLVPGYSHAPYPPRQPGIDPATRLKRRRNAQLELKRLAREMNKENARE